MCVLVFAISLLFWTASAHLESSHDSGPSPSDIETFLETSFLQRNDRGLGAQVPVGIVQGSASYVAPDPASRAKLAVPALQTWYNKTTGLWETTGWWNGANIVTMLGDYARAFPADAEAQTVTRQIFSNALARAPMKNPQPGIEDAASYSPNSGSAEFQTGYFKDRDPVTFEPHSRFPPHWKDENKRVSKFNAPYYPAKPDPHAWLDGFYDDDLWWALAWINAYDVTHHQQYLDLAEGIFLAVARTWGTNCWNGGIYWSWEKNYVNAIANELFFSTAAHLANRIQSRKQTYLDWAKKSLDWFFASGMINSEGTINDGLTDKCQNNGKTTWSYNQGVILGGLVELHRVDTYPKYDYLRTAHDIALAALKKLSAPPERCGGRPLVQVTHDAGTIAPSGTSGFKDL
jgi:hypothetical protein